MNHNCLYCTTQIPENDIMCDVCEVLNDVFDGREVHCSITDAYLYTIPVYSDDGYMIRIADKVYIVTPAELEFIQRHLGTTHNIEILASPKSSPDMCEVANCKNIAVKGQFVCEEHLEKMAIDLGGEDY